MAISKELQQKMIGQIPSIAGNTATLPITAITFPSEKKTSYLRKIAPCLAFFAAFFTAMTLLLIWSEATALRRQAFDVNMTRDYVLHQVKMDDPQLLQYIREVHFVKSVHREPINVTQTEEEKLVEQQLQNKRNGVYVEYINRPGAVSTTSWLEDKRGWHGLFVTTDFRSFMKASKSGRHPATRILHACLSTNRETKEITYHQESDVRVTKLDGGPNSLSSPDEGLTGTRIKCFPLYSVLLAYNQTSVDYLSLDSTDLLEGQVLDTIPWELIRISVLSIRRSYHHNDSDLNNLIEKLTARRYRIISSTDTEKLIFTYTRLLKI